MLAGSFFPTRHCEFRNSKLISTVFFSFNLLTFLYKLLRTANAALKERSDVSHFSIDGFDVIFTNEIIYLCLDGRICERYYRSGVSQSPSHLLSKMKKDIARLLDKKDKDKEKRDEAEDI